MASLVNVEDAIAALQEMFATWSDPATVKSLGIALEDVAFADLIWRRAVERGIGTPLPRGFKPRAASALR